MSRSSFLPWLLVASCWALPQSAAFNGSGYLQFTPSGSAWQSLSSWRVEFRLHGFGVSTQLQGVFGNNDGDWQCQIPPNTTTLRCRTFRGMDDHLNVDLKGRRDVRVRFQRDNGTGKISLEAWNADGSGYVVSQSNFTRGSYNGQRANYIGSLWGTGSQLSGSIGFVRCYSGVVALASSPPFDQPREPGDLLNVDFDGEAADTGRFAFPLVLRGTTALSYVNSQTFPPVVIVKAPAAARAGQSVTVDFGQTYAINGDGTLATFTIEQVDGPIVAPLTAQNGAALDFLFPITGTYRFLVKAKDQLGLETELTQGISAVASDDDGRITPFDESAKILLGPMLRSGESPWPWFDQTEVQVADALATAIEDSPGKPLAGTLEVRRGSTEIQGTGTAFKTTFKCDGSDNIAVHYPLDGDTGTPRKTGLRVYIVLSCASDTQLTIYPAFDATSIDWRGVPYGRVTNEQNGRWYNGSNNWNYYDAVLAYYRLYYRTGNEKYRNMARDLADRWYRYPLDEGRACLDGYWCVAPRVKGLLGLMLRANDGRPEMWPVIVRLANSDYVSFIQNWLPDQSQNVFDLREAGYATWWQAVIAGMHPDAEVRQAALAKATNAFHKYWKPRQHPDGSWRMDINYACPVCGYDGPGTLPWQMAFSMHGLVALHQLTGDEEVLQSLRLGVDFVRKFGIDPECRGMFYEVFYTKCNGGECGKCEFGTCGKYNCTAGGAYPSNPSRTLSNAMHAIIGYVYYATGDEIYRSVGDDLFAANLGGTKGGPFTDGGHGNYNDVVSGGSAPAFLTMTYLSKEFAFVGGAGSAQNYLAWRLGPPPPVELSEVEVAAEDLASISEKAVSARVVLLRPSGQQEGFGCEEGRCRVRFNPRLGQHLYVVQYLDSEGAVVANGKLALLPWV